LPLSLERDRENDGPLAFPTQLFYDAKGRRLYVADSGHNRVVVLDEKGRFKGLTGNGAIDYRDGDAALAGFDHTEGVAAGGGFLYIADTVNDVIRRVDAKGRVATVIDEPAVRWPRGLAFAGDALYATAAETHDVWLLPAAARRPLRFAGSSASGRRDGALPLAE